MDQFSYTSDGTLTNRRTFVEIPETDGIPDGLTVDANGGVWVALWGGSAVHRYTPIDDLDQVISMSARHVTACTFGGPHLDELYITTSALGLDTGAEPSAGSLFRCSPGVQGVPTLGYAG